MDCSKSACGSVLAKGSTWKEKGSKGFSVVVEVVVVGLVVGGWGRPKLLCSCSRSPLLAISSWNLRCSLMACCSAGEGVVVRGGLMKARGFRVVSC